MSKRQRMNKKTSRLGLIVLVNVLVLFFLVIGFGREYLGNLQVEREIRELEEERASLETEKLETLELIDQLSSEYYLEQQARTKHGLGKDGETLVIVQQDDQSDPFDRDTLEEPSFAEQIGNPLRWFYYFFDQDSFRRLQDL